MNLPIPQKAILKPITNASGSGIMALWLCDNIISGYAWPTGRLNRLFLGPKMFTLISEDNEKHQPQGLYCGGVANTFEEYIRREAFFFLDFEGISISKGCLISVMSDDPGTPTLGKATFQLEPLTYADLEDPRPLIPVHRVFFTVDHDHMFVTNETELELILSGKYGKANYEGIAFYAVSAGRE